MKRVHIECSGETIFPACYVADGFFTKGRGLLFRDQEYSRNGLLLVNNNSIHMIGMRYPITCVVLDKHLIVRKVKIVKAGFHFITDFKAKHILECHVDQYENLLKTVGNTFVLKENSKI